jgi:two-component system chemotaxis response regulator CheB
MLFSKKRSLMDHAPSTGQDSPLEGPEKSVDADANLGQDASQPAIAVVGLGASAGGLSALSQVLSALPADFPAPVLVVEHMMPGNPSVLAAILSRRTRLAVKEAEDGEQLEPGIVYIAPPDAHTVVGRNRRIAIDRMTPPVRHLRPSVDVLFESLAVSHGQHALAVVLSGTGHDGTAGALALKRAGGMVIAQDEESSEFFGMPGAAIESGAANFVLPLSEIAGALERLAADPVA